MARNRITCLESRAQPKQNNGINTVPMRTIGNLEDYFSRFRIHIIGNRHWFETPFGRKRIVYADWTASGRAYGPIEKKLQEEILPFFGNTHTETTITGTTMSKAYEHAKEVIKAHVNANKDDILIFCGSGMTDAVNKLQRIIGLRIPERAFDYLRFEKPTETQRPIVFVTHMEHHSNHTSWLETIAQVEIINRRDDGNVDIEHLRQLLERFKNRPIKIAAVTACSNVTGIETPYHDIAILMHENNGYCFVDFASSAPYVQIDMHRGGKLDDLDAIYFSFHKFLGGPGTPGVLIFNKKLYKNQAPDRPGGGTILYSNPWNQYEYVEDIEQREDGGTPPILQAIKAGMCICLKEKMGIQNILTREKEIVKRVFERMSVIEGIEILEGTNRNRLAVISFTIKEGHYDLFVRMLNDRFGIQARGGCSCAGTYGHVLLGIDKIRSNEIRKGLLAGDLSCKPGWVRVSFHPTMTDQEVDYISDAIREVVKQFHCWEKV